MAKKKKDETPVICYMCHHEARANQDVQFVRIGEESDICLCEDCLQTLMQVVDESRMKDAGFIVSDFHEEIDETTYRRRAHAQANKTKPQEDILNPARALPRPAQIKDYLDQYIIGQEEAKQILSVAAYNHYKLLRHQELCKKQRTAVAIEKSNIIMCGASGVGKTATIKRLAEFMKVPVAICDCAGLSKTGYVGRDPLNILLELIQKANGDIEAAEHGIIYLDEFDKLAKRTDALNKDVTGEGVQQELLKLIEGNVVEVNVGGSTPTSGGTPIHFDTTNVLFICGGAFAGLEKIISQRLKGNSGEGEQPVIGFGRAHPIATAGKGNDTASLTQVTSMDFMNYGIVPEILGRLPIICPLRELTPQEFVRILTEPKNAIVRQYEALFAIDDATLIFESGALKAIAAEAIDRKTGARGLRGIMERVLNQAMYAIPNINQPVEVIVSAACVKKGKMPLIRKQMPDTVSA